MAGLTAQLEALATKIKSEMDAAYAMASGPDERNPSYEPDRINDRWPTSQTERKTLAEDMVFLLDAIRTARTAEMKDLLAILKDLFGERASERSFSNFVGRMDQRVETKSINYERGTGAVVGSVSLAAPAVARAASPVPQHSFHCEEAD